MKGAARKPKGGAGTNPGPIKSLLGSPWSWLTPFPALKSSYQYARSSLHLRLRLAAFFRVALAAMRSMRWTTFEWSGRLGLIFSGFALLFAFTGQVVNAAIMTVALVASCFLKVERHGRE